MDLFEKNIFWDRLLKGIEERVNVQSFTTWFKPLVLKELTKDTLVISVPQPYFSSWLEEHYLPLITSVSRSILGYDIAILFSFSDSLEDKESPPQTFPEENNPREATYRSALKNDTAFLDQLNLNSRFTFDTFVVGHSNQFAYAAAKAVAEAPGNTAFNPLVMYGGVGLGKTHILQAIAHHYLNSVKAQKGMNRVIYVSSEKFTMDFILSIQNKLASQYSKYYRTANLLLIDDIQFFNNKERTQEEFFHIFNDLHQKGKQIVLTMDCPPAQLKGLADRLINRFQWGLVTDIQPPDFETRIAILQKKALNDGVNLDPSIAEYIAEHITSNIRELEGSLIRLLAYSSLHGQDLSLDMAVTILGDTIRKPSKLITIEYIQKMVSEHFSISPNMIIGESRHKEIAAARHIAIYLCKQLTSSSLKTIGLHFGGRDHSTVIHSISFTKNKIVSDPAFSKQVHTLIEKAKNPDY
ncbi:MAG: chromosomal replication initiator protein DnaA [Candidatus Latescibacterota bacterium]